MSRISNDVILRFQGFQSSQERIEIGGILATFVTGILELADDPKEAANYCNYFLTKRLSRKERKKVANFLVVYENRPGRNKAFPALESAQEFTSPSTLFIEHSKMWGAD